MATLNSEQIEQNARRILDQLPEGVVLVAAAKTRSAEQVLAVLRAGVNILGYNYLQEAEKVRAAVGSRARYHMIGHLQRNKAKPAASLFDMVQTVDNLRLAQKLNRHCAELGRRMPVLIEVNSAGEPNKSGVAPAEVDRLADALVRLPGLQLEGLMTMGPFTADPEDLRPNFRLTRRAFERLQRRLETDAKITTLSMGMSDSYSIALEEGATMVRLGSILFGPRQPAR